jgi:excisionase family DNA binding protein
VSEPLKFLSIDAEAIGRFIDERVEAKLASRPAASNEWLSLERAAKRVGCSKRTIERKIESGELPASRSTGHPRVAASDLDEWMRAGVGTRSPAQHSSPRRPRPAAGTFGALVKEDRREEGRRR